MCETDISSFHAVIRRVYKCLVRSGTVNMMIGCILRHCVCRRYCGGDDSEACNITRLFISISSSLAACFCDRS